MQVQIGIENGFENKSIAFGLDYPGCFSVGSDQAEALLLFPGAFFAHQNWINANTSESWLKNIRDIDIRLVDTWQVYAVDENYAKTEENGKIISAWFQTEWKPLNRMDVVHGLKMLEWSRADLLNVIADLDEETLNRIYPGERWSIRGIVRHIGSVEWWLLDRLNQAGMTKPALPTDPLERCAVTRSRLETVLPDLAGIEMVIGKEGEFWSPRKLLRRVLWHEKDHILHIQKLLAKTSQP